MRQKTAIACMAAVLMWQCSFAQAGEVSGKLLNPKGIPAPHIYESVNIFGSNPAGSGTYTNATGNDGIFYNPGLPAGIYSQGFSEKESFELLYFKGLNVPASGNTWHIRQFNPATFCFGTEWFYTWHNWYAQSFRATGENVISVGIRTAGAAESNIAVAVLDGDNPYAPQIGPTRTAGVSSTNGQCAYWSAGEVPTVPGQVYTVRFTLPGGGQFSPWHQTVRWRMRSENPDGRTWMDGVEIDEPLEMTVNQDDAGLINTMCCARQFGYTLLSQYGGQTFTARGTCVLAVTWLTGSSALWAVSIHDGPGNGSGGPQIGPTKYVNGVAWDGRSVVTFAPDEVPTVPGHVYYVKLRLAAGGAMVIYDLGGQDFYSGGQAYADGVAQAGRDFAIAVYEQKYAGSLDQPSVGIASFGVDTITDSSAVVRWYTSPAADSTAEYGEATPYSSSVYDPALVTTHSVTLTGLKANTMYHVRATSRASGARPVVTKDMVFVTVPSTYNMLADPGFESGAFGKWTKFGVGSIGIVTAPYFADAGPRTGAYGLGGATNGGTVQGGAYQRVPAVPGSEYRLSAWVYTYTVGDLWSKSYQCIARIGIDPTGGTDPNSASILWTPYTNSPEAWTQIATKATATSDYLTVFLYAGNEQGITWSVFSYDDIILTGPPPTDASIAQAVSEYPDGSYVKLSGAICTATNSQAPNYYVESPDRTAGLRISTLDAMGLNDRVTLVGFLRTRVSGERLLDNAAVVSRAPATAIRPISARSAHIGGASPGPYCPGIPGTVGPYNVGTLMRACGKVAVVSGKVYLSDGSMAGEGIRVDNTGLATAFATGQKAAVTGIVRLEGAAGSATVVLDPRFDADVRLF